MDNYLGTYLALSAGVLLFALLVGIVAYIISALAVKRVLKYFNHERTWAAWIPLYNLIALTECIDEDSDGNIIVFSQKIPKKYAKLWPLLALLSGIPVIGTVVAIVNVVCSVLLYIGLLSQESQSEELALGIVSGLIPIVWIVLCFVRFKGQRQITNGETYIIEDEK